MRKFIEIIRFVGFLLFVTLESCVNKTENKPNSDVFQNKQTDTLSNKNQHYVEYYENGQIRMEGDVVNGKREGVWKSYYENGALWSTGFYLNGKRQGIGVVMYNNGKKYMEGEYKDDRRAGKWIFYNEKGEIIKEENFN